MKFIDGEPPAASTTRNGRWKEILTALKSRPGEWADIPGVISPRQRSYLLRKAGCQVRTDGEKFYARWPVDPDAR